MPRVIEFNRDDVLAKAMALFWRQGYNGTSVAQLCETMDLQPGSLYGAFKNKRTLFLAALDHYFAHIEAFVFSILRTNEPPLRRIEHFFDALIDEIHHDPDAKGCLLVNTLVETPATDQQINGHVSDMFKMVERELAAVLKLAQQRCDLSDSKDPEALAKLLVTGIYGLRAYGKMPGGAKDLTKIKEELLSVLG